MKLLFFLSGSNTSFASEEVISLLGAYNIKYELIFAEGQFLIIDVDHIDLSFIFRLGLTHFVLNVIIESNIYEEVEKITSKIE